MATDQPLEEVNQHEEEGGEEYNPQEAEKTVAQSSDQQNERDNKSRDTRSKSPQSSIGEAGKSAKKDIECKVFLLNGDVITVSVDVSYIILVISIIIIMCTYLCIA